MKYQRTFTKVRFTSKLNGNTAGLVFDDDFLEGKTIQDISRLFPVSEAMKMERLELSQSFTTWEEAFQADI